MEPVTLEPNSNTRAPETCHDRAHRRHETAEGRRQTAAHASTNDSRDEEAARHYPGYRHTRSDKQGVVPVRRVSAVSLADTLSVGVPRLKARASITMVHVISIGGFLEP